MEWRWNKKENKCTLIIWSTGVTEVSRGGQAIVALSVFCEVLTSCTFIWTTLPRFKWWFVVYEGRRMIFSPFCSFFVPCCSVCGVLPQWRAGPRARGRCLCCRHQHEVPSCWFWFTSVHRQFICLNGSEKAITLHEFNISVCGALWRHSHVRFVTINGSVSPYTNEGKQQL